MFKTVPICILSAGHTIDGREVTEETIDQIAESYDPKTYSARINIEHNQYGTKLGSVLSLSTQVVDGVKRLFAELKPNDYLLYLVQQGQKLHTSCEIVHNFAKTGKAYLTGLAVTDTPASLGTTEMHLSDESQSVEVFTTEVEPIQFDKDKEEPFFKNPFSKKEDDSMDKATLELIQQLNDQQSKTTQALNGLNEKIDNLSLNHGSKDDDQANDSEPPVKNSDSEEKTELSQMADTLQQLSATVQALNETSQQTTTILTKLSQETDEGFRHQATGEDDDHEENVL